MQRIHVALIGTHNRVVPWGTTLLGRGQARAGKAGGPERETTAYHHPTSPVSGFGHSLASLCVCVCVCVCVYMSPRDRSHLSLALSPAPSLSKHTQSDKYVCTVWDHKGIWYEGQSLWIDTSPNDNTSIPLLSARRGCKVPEGLRLVLPRISSCCSKEASSSQERERASARREWHGVHASFVVRLLSLHVCVDG